jgi:hypothetical protein
MLCAVQFFVMSSTNFAMPVVSGDVILVKIKILDFRSQVDFPQDISLFDLLDVIYRITNSSANRTLEKFYIKYSRAFPFPYTSVATIMFAPAQFSF